MMDKNYLSSVYPTKNVKFICIASLFRTLWKWEKIMLTFIVSNFFFSYLPYILVLYFFLNVKYLPYEDLFDSDTIRQVSLLIFSLIIKYRC